MKFLLLMFLSIFSSAYSQNLVPNPSFEDTIDCPEGGDQLFKAISWYAFRDSPDYFHLCCNDKNNCVVGVPSNALGYQFPHSGNAYGGLTIYDLTGAPFREYLAVQLSPTTIPNKKYYATFFVNWSGSLGFTIGANKIGIALSTNAYSQSNSYPITNNPIAFSDSIITDSLNWTKLQFSFIADSAYQYLIIGNFFDDANTDTLNLGQFNVHCYHYIDDVCLTTDSVYAANFANSTYDFSPYSEKLLNKYAVKNNNLFLEFNHWHKENNIQLYNYLGQLLYSKTTSNEKEIIPLLNNGFFILTIQNQNKSQTTKIINP